MAYIEKFIGLKADLSAAPVRCPHCNERTEKEKPWKVVECKKITDTVLVKESNSYSFGKGLAGVALFGAVGAVAGINGKKGGTSTKKINKGYYFDLKCPCCNEKNDITTDWISEEVKFACNLL